MATASGRATFTALASDRQFAVDALERDLKLLADSLVDPDPEDAPVIQGYITKLLLSKSRFVDAHASIIVHDFLSDEDVVQLNDDANDIFLRVQQVAQQATVWEAGLTQQSFDKEEEFQEALEESGIEPPAVVGESVVASPGRPVSDSGTGTVPKSGLAEIVRPRSNSATAESSPGEIDPVVAIYEKLISLSYSFDENATRMQCIQQSISSLEARQARDVAMITGQLRTLEDQIQVAAATLEETGQSPGPQVTTSSKTLVSGGECPKDAAPIVSTAPESSQAGVATSASPGSNVGLIDTFSCNTETKVSSSDSGTLLVNLLQESRNFQESIVASINAPKLELFVFDGNPRNYWPFIRAFESVIESKIKDSCVKLNSLLQYCSPTVRNVLSCTLVKTPSEGYLLARKLLKERYGHSYTISQSWLKHLSQYPNIRNSSTLQSYADDVNNCYETLQEMGFLKELECSKIMKDLISKLPSSVQNRWVRQYHDALESKREYGMKELVTLVTRAAREASDPQFGEFCMSSNRPGNNPAHRPGKPFNNFNFNNPRSPAAGQVKPSMLALPAPTATSGPPGPRAASPLVNYTSPKVRCCALCNNNHHITTCNQFLGLQDDDVMPCVRLKKLCLICLNRGHFANKCLSKSRCKVPGCTARHHTLIHNALMAEAAKRGANNIASVNSNHVSVFPEVVAAGQAENPVSDSAAPVEPHPVVSNMVLNYVAPNTFLPVVPVLVGGEDGLVKTDALLDPGSSMTFINRSLASRVKVDKHSTTWIRLSTLTGEKSCSCDVVDLRVYSIHNRRALKQYKIFNAVILESLPVLSKGILTHKDALKWPHLAKLNLPDHSTGSVDILIGQDNSHLLIPYDRVLGVADDEPYGLLTALGWIFYGSGSPSYSYHVSAVSAGAVAKKRKVTTNNARVKSQVPISTSAVVREPDFEDDILRCLHKLWEVDVAPQASALTQDEQRVLDLWHRTIRVSNNQISLPIPFKTGKPNLPNNYPQALHRLNLLKSRLLKDEELKIKYLAAMEKYINSDYAELVSHPKNFSNSVFYIPHHPVFHKCKKGKCRIVFDCSATFKNISLNKAVSQGPDLCNRLTSVLIKFRQHKVAFMGDIEAMYNRVKVIEEHRDCLRFLWFKNNDLSQPLTVFRMTTHLFGGVWSPAAAIYALRMTAEMHSEEFCALVTDTVNENFYVDDCLKSVNTQSEAIFLIHNLCKLLKRSSFRLTKFISNHPAVLESVPETDRAQDLTSFNLDFDDLNERALGCSWKVNSDSFSFSSVDLNKPLTKRGLLSVTSSLYDPLGFASPYVLPAKHIFQGLCKLKLSWDDPIPEPYLSSWKRWTDDLPIIAKFSIPRCLNVFGSKSVICDLHIFSDASEYAYASVAYGVFYDTNKPSEKYSILLFSKSRLAPLKNLTIPRLELCAAHLSVKIYKELTAALEIPISQTYFWTDSMIVLQYLYSTTRTFKTFVANRVSNILQYSTAKQWYFVPTKLNIADLASRGCSASNLLNNSVWVYGPSFIISQDFPDQPSLDSLDSDHVECKLPKMIYHVKADPIPKNVSSLHPLFSSAKTWFQLVKQVAWLLRFKYFLLGRPDLSPLKVTDLRSAELIIFQHVQLSFTASQIKSHSFQKLFPVSSDGLWRVGGRLQLAHVDFDTQHPILLPTFHPVTSLIVFACHIISGHGPLEATLGQIRQRFWILSARTIIKKIIKNCHLCKRLNAKAGVQLMAPLPADRFSINSKPFAFTGLDFFGPFFIKSGRSVLKRYGCIFTCLNIRAVHLELVTSLDTPSFLMCLERFISRRGKPLRLRSDNGTNFVGAKSELQKMISSWNRIKLNNFFLQQDIEWIFNTPLASHHGGVWERIIRSTRSLLLKLNSEQCQSDEGLATLFCMVEQILNNRPICKLSSDINDERPLSPSHLLILSSGSSDPAFLGHFDKPDSYRNRWKQTQYLASLFWTKWLAAYLPTLQLRVKWDSSLANLKVGDLVLLPDTTSRLCWPLGLIVEVIPSRDNLVRSVKVKTQSGIYTRPITKVYKLEGDE